MVLELLGKLSNWHLVHYSLSYIKLEDTGSRGHEFKLKKRRSTKGCTSQFLFLVNSLNNRYLDQASVTRHGHSMQSFCIYQYKIKSVITISNMQIFFPSRELTAIT